MARTLGAASFLVLPFLIFWWTFPFVSRRTIGNDYGWFVPLMQMELQFALRTGTVPLFVPGFNGGQTSAALTHGQLFHPLPHLAAAVPGYWTGQALEAATLLKLLSLGLGHMVLFRFLRRLRLRPVPAWLVAFAGVYNLRMLDSFRYNIALEAYTGLLLLCASLGFLFLDPDARWPRLAIAVCAFLVVASGHPQWAYFALIGAGVFVLALPFALAAIVPGWRAERRRRSTVIAFVAMAVGVLLASAYAVPFYLEFMRDNTGRVGREYDWAVEISQSLAGLIRSLYDPLHSDVHGSFAGNALIVLIAGVPALPLLRIRVPPVMLGLWGFCALVVVAAAGGSIYRFLFDHLPLWSSFRVPGRLTLVMMPALLLLMAWVASPPGEERHEAKGRLEVLGLLAAAMLIIWQVTAHVFPAVEPQYSPQRINRLSGWEDTVQLGLLSASLAALAAMGWSVRRRAPWLEAGCALIVVVHASAVMLWGTWRWPKKPTQSFVAMREAHRRTGWLLGGLGEQTLTSAPMDRYLESADRDSRLAWISHRCVRVGSLDEAYGFVRDRRWPDELIVEAPPDACESGSEEAAASTGDVVELEYASFNRFVFRARSARRGFLAVNIPYTRWDRTAWRAHVNGEPVSIVRANGIAQAVAIRPGASRVELRYWSWPAFVGLVISAGTAAALLAYAAGALRARRWRIAARVGAVAAMALCVQLWAARLYAGEGWGTAYSWTGPGQP